MKIFADPLAVRLLTPKEREAFEAFYINTLANHTLNSLSHRQTARSWSESQFELM